MKRHRDRTSKNTRARIMLSMLILGGLVFVSCARDPRLESLQLMEQDAGISSEERIQELKDVIEEYASVVEEKVRAGTRQASYLKLLAQEYMRNEMYGPALDALTEAILLEPRNQVLHQLSGVCAGYLGKAQAEPAARQAYFAMAERSYKYSLEIDPAYIDGLFGLGTLYHFELAQHLEAVRVLEELTRVAPSYIPGLFVLARAHAALGNIDEAVTLYDEIIDKTEDRETATTARRNRQLLTGGDQ